jgi:tetratricopeptide (TPR) repeat protein
MRILFFLAILFFYSCSESKVSIIENMSDIAELSEKILDNPNDTFLLIRRKNYFLKRKQLEAALIDIEHLFKLDSLNYNRTFDLASTYFFLAESGKSEYYVKALNVLNVSRVTEKADFASLLMRAKLYYLFKMYEYSLIDLNNALRVNKYDADAYFYKGLNLKEMGDIKSAIPQFQTSVAGSRVWTSL